MRKLYRGVTIAIAVLSFFFTEHAKAFSLLGPYADWMTPTNGFQLSGDIGGPMDIGRGYRWNVPVITYGFDVSFLDYFGTNGVAAVESAIAILNNLPAASQLDPSNFPLDTTRMNTRAAADGLIDLKSTTLSLLVQQLGLAQPSRYTAALHDFSVTGGTVNGHVVQRNFDPFSFAPTNAVNGVQYAYYLSLLHTNPDIATWSVFLVDPLNPLTTAVADWDPRQSSNVGSFLTGLTRDDAGGLRYLIQSNNYNFETLLPDVHGTGTNSAIYANGTVRAGVDKITFVRMDADSLLADTYTPLTNHYVDTYMTNSTVVHQQLERVISKPDIIFSAFSDSDNNVVIQCTGTTNWLNESINLEGPGIIRPQVKIAFQEMGNALATTDDSSSPGCILSMPTRWASFDGSTNPPVIYPLGWTAGQVANFPVNLLLNPTNFASREFTWNVPVGYGATATLQTSTNMHDWVSRGTVTNLGTQLNWIHLGTAPQNFFRIVTNSP